MKILHVTCSSRATSSESTRLSDEIVSRLLALHPQAKVIERNLAAMPMPHADVGYISELSSFEGDPTARHDMGSLAISEQLISELEGAAFIVIATPMHNFTVPSVLKAWIDHVVRVKRTFIPTPEGKIGSLVDRPVFVSIASGGIFAGEGASQPDFLRPYLQAALSTMGLRDIRFFLLQGMVYGPEMVASSWRSALAALDEQTELAAIPEKASA